MIGDEVAQEHGNPTPHHVIEDWGESLKAPTRSSIVRPERANVKQLIILVQRHSISQPAFSS